MEKNYYLLIEEGINKLKNKPVITWSLCVSSIAFFLENVNDLGIIFSMVFLFFLFHNIKHFFSQKDLAKRDEDILFKNENVDVDRKDLAVSILKKIFASKSTYHVLVGTSGAGKSELIERYFQSALNSIFEDKKKQIIRIKEYTSFEEQLDGDICQRFNIEKTNLWSDLEKLRNKDQLFVVLDQFESVFLIDSDIVKDQLKSLCKFFTFAKQFKIYILIIIRKEWYFNLKFFQSYVPQLKDVHIVDGFTSGEETKKLKNEALRIMGNDDLAKKIITDCTSLRKPEMYYVTSCEDFENYLLNNKDNQSQLLPIEIITVLDSLMIMSKKKGAKISEADYVKEGGKDDIIRKYFEELLHSSKNEKDAQRALYALSVEPKINRRLDGATISTITNVELEKVNQILTFFMKKEIGHIVEIDKKYDWKHDFYAEKFNEISGTLLDPIDRDNINFFWSQNYSNKISSDKFRVDENKLNKNQILGVAVFVISLLFLFVKLCMPGIDKLVSAVFSLPFTSHALFTISKYQYEIIDYSFLPIAVCLTMWSWYVTTLFRRFLARIKESNLQKIYSKIVCWWSLICVVITIILPEFWLTFTGIGGIVVALKYYQITRPIKSHFEIKRLSKETLINSLVLTAVIGPVYAFVFPRFSLFGKIEDWAFIIISLVTMGIMIYFARLSIKNHVSHYKIPILLGLYNRTQIFKDIKNE